jgi:DNA-binding NarL/FixJ family response regulator
MRRTIRVAVADDHAIVREGLRMLLLSRPLFTLVGEANDGHAALSMTLEARPDVLVLDLKLPLLDGVGVLRALARQAPAVRALVFTSFDDDTLVHDAIAAGAAGYLLKDVLPERLLEALRAVAGGDRPIDPGVARKLLDRQRSALGSEPVATLTNREREVLTLVARGLSNQQIAGRLVIREPTVARHVSNILQKLGLDSRTQATLFALRHGLAALDPAA